MDMGENMRLEMKANLLFKVIKITSVSMLSQQFQIPDVYRITQKGRPKANCTWSELHYSSLN